MQHLTNSIILRYNILGWNSSPWFELVKNYTIGKKKLVLSSPGSENYVAVGHHQLTYTVRTASLSLINICRIIFHYK